MKTITARYLPVSGESSKRIAPRPTSTPKPEDELILNRSDPTDNRGKVNRVNSFEIAQERAANLLKMSKGGPIKNSSTKNQPRQSTSNQMESHRSQLGCTACGGHDHLRKDCVRMYFATTAGPDLTLRRCVEHYHNRPQVTFYAFIVAVPATLQVSVITNPTTTEKSQGLLQETLGNQDPGWTTIG